MELENVQEIGLCETRNMTASHMSIRGPLPIASPAEHRHQEVDKNMWERLEDLGRLREDGPVVWEREKGEEVERRL